MKVAVVGLWHLGSVTAACLAGGKHDVIALDFDPKICEYIKLGKGPVYEPGLDDLLSEGLRSGKLCVASHPDAITQADIVWITYDTPVNELDVADVDVVLKSVQSVFPYIRSDALLLVSSQLPVGTTRQIKRSYAAHYPDREVRLAYIPENLRLGNAIQIFTAPDRVVAGLEDQQDRGKIAELLQPFTGNIIWMSIESAEMTKHALNSFLALSVTFINEIASICEAVGGDAREVELGLKSEARIGNKARLSPGGAIAGGTLLRDVHYLLEAGQQHHCKTGLLEGLVDSNEHHKSWLQRKLQKALDLGQARKVAVLGLAYKAGTDTLRRSAAVEVCQWLSCQGVDVMAWDPAVKCLPETLTSVIQLKSSMQSALQGADIAIVATDWPEFKAMTTDEWLAAMRSPSVLDPSGWLMGVLGSDSRIVYQRVGYVHAET